MNSARMDTDMMDELGPEATTLFIRPIRVYA